MKWLKQVRLLLEKGANVEGNIDLDLDILSETPLQVLLYFVTISMKWSSWEFSWELSGQDDVKTKIFWNHSSSLLPPVGSRLWNFFSVLEHRPSCLLWRWQWSWLSWLSPWSPTEYAHHVHFNHNLSHRHDHNQVDTMSFGSSAQKGCYCALSTAASHGQR